jgi:putative spermidine/putrescine transport system substrate-binding protein
MSNFTGHTMPPHPTWRNAPAIERRAMLGLLAGSAAASVLSRAAHAATTELVLSNWGGTAEKAIMAAYADACKAETGLTLSVDGSGPMSGKVRAMEEAHHVTWDIIDLDLGDTTQLGEAGLLEEIDYDIVDKSKVVSGLTTKWGVANYLYSFIFAVNEKRAHGMIPKTWAEFWDVKTFPGKRALPGFAAQGMWEATLLADGVDPKKIYPIDVDRALAKIRQIKADCVFWKTGAQSEDLLRQNEVLANMMWSNRAWVVRRQMKTGITWTWDGAVLAASGWSVPKDNPAGKQAAMKFINLSLDPAGQAKVFDIVGMSPSNPAASAMIPADDRPFDAAEHIDNQVVVSDAWYSQYGDAAEAKYLETISS